MKTSRVAILSALNIMPPFSKPDYLHRVKANRPEFLKTGRLRMRTTGEWERELGD